MIGKLLIAAGFGALLSVAPALAQDVQQQGMSSEQTQSDQLYKKKKSNMTQPQGQTTGQTNGNEQQTEQNQATGQEGQPAKKKKLQQNTQTEEMNQQPTGQGQPAKKLKKTQQVTTEGQEPTAQTKKLKKQATGSTSEGQMTTGATGKIATDISPEKRTVVRQKLVSTKVQRVERSKINVTLTVGVRVPRTIRFYPVPREIIRLVPAYRGYLYFVLDDGTIILVDPRTYEVAYVITA
jgi:Protein of unknown function (DUF1236)